MEGKMSVRYRQKPTMCLPSQDGTRQIGKGKETRHRDNQRDRLPENYRGNVAVKRLCA